MAENTLEYTKVTVAIDWSAAMGRGKQIEERSAKNKKDGANNWGIIALKAVSGGWLQVDSEMDLEDIAQIIRGRLADDILADELIDIPEFGHDSTGKKIKLRHEKDTKQHKAGDVKWASWRRTKSIFKYCGPLSKIAKAGLVEDLTEDNKVAGKTGIERMATAILETPKSPLELVKQFLDSAGEQISVMDSEEIESAETLIKAFLINTVEAAKKA